MSEVTNLQTKFEASVAQSKELTERPDNMTLLRLYALYKQGSEGDCTGDRPGMTQFVERAKYDAWASLKGKSSDEAKQAYITLIDELAA
jgi:diazepam-binding inhibitor (GABA receptor modulator, acyl-CoA-binding protein)